MNPHMGGKISGCHGWSVTQRQTIQQEAVVAVMASDMQNNTDCLPASPLPAEEQLITSAHPSCTHGGFHTPTWLMGIPAMATALYFRKSNSLWVLCFSVTADGPPEPCWYCLRTQESGSRPETGQQVFVVLFFLFYLRFQRQWFLFY